MNFDDNTQEDFAEDKDSLHYGGTSALDNSEAIISKRWESEGLIWQLWKTLADREPQVNANTGKIELVRIHPSITPLMNDEGAQRVISLIRAHINPVVALSNYSDDDARSLFGHTMRNVISALVLGQEQYGIKSTSDLRFIVAEVKTLVFAQLMRAVKGHESKWSKTNIQEFKQDQYAEHRTRGGVFDWGSNKR